MPEEQGVVLAEKCRWVRELALKLMAEFGLDGWQFCFNRRRRCLGLCVFSHGDRAGRIELSVHYVNLNSLEQVRDTLLHEIAHALAGPAAGHGPLWKQWCVRVGAEPQRLCTDAVLPKGKWAAVCGGCGFQHTRFRRPKAHWYRCNFCQHLVTFQKQSYLGGEARAGSPGLRPEAASALNLFRAGGMG